MGQGLPTHSSPIRREFLPSRPRVSRPGWGVGGAPHSQTPLSAHGTPRASPAGGQLSTAGFFDKPFPWVFSGGLRAPPPHTPACKPCSSCCLSRSRVLWCRWPSSPARRGRTPGGRGPPVLDDQDRGGTARGPQRLGSPFHREDREWSRVVVSWGVKNGTGSVLLSNQACDLAGAHVSCFGTLTTRPKPTGAFPRSRCKHAAPHPRRTHAHTHVRRERKEVMPSRSTPGSNAAPGTPNSPGCPHVRPEPRPPPRKRTPVLPDHSRPGAAPPGSRLPSANTKPEPGVVMCAFGLRRTCARRRVTRPF